MADVEKAWKHFELCEAECKGLLEGYSALTKAQHPKPVSPANGETQAEHRDKSRFPLLAAYDLCLKCSHLFNILDARGAISVTERVGVIARVRALAVGIAKSWVDQQTERVGFGGEQADEPAPASEKKKSKKEALSPAAV